MQQLCGSPRNGFTEDQIVELLQNSPSLVLAGGLEIVDLGLNVIEDISDDLAGGSIQRQSFADLHATANLSVTRELDWGAGLVRPYMVVSNGTYEARFNLGVFHVNTPTHSTAESPPTFQVEGYDILLRLAQPVGDAYAIAAGDSYLATVEEILLSRGYERYIIDQTASDKVAPTARVWAFDDATTWMTVVNNLLASVGYQGIWSDWDGRLRCEPYILPADRRVEWTYTDDPTTTMIGVETQIQRDFFSSPNMWVFYRQNNVDDVAPVEGKGIYTYVNQSVGETSVDARGGLVIPKVQSVDSADQGSLIAQGNATIAADMDIPTIVSVKVSPNPLHWHFDRLLFQHSAFSIADMQCTSWTLSLPPSTDDMQLELRVISQ